MIRRIAAALLTGSLAVTACGAPTARQVEDGDASIETRDLERITFVIPSGWEETEPGDARYAGSTFAPTEGQAGFSAPQFQFETRQGSDQLSIEALRREPLGGVDPLSEDIGETQLMSYGEIATADAWGIRIALVDGNGQTFDWQALVDRRDQSVTTSLIFCNLRCMIDHDDIVDEIQTSWSPGGDS